MDISLSAGSEVSAIFENAFRARSVRCEKLRIAIPSNRQLDMLLDGVKGMRMPVLKRLEWDIVHGERLAVDLEPREEVGDPAYGPDMRMFGWNALRPGFALFKHHALLGWLGATYRITTLSIKYLPGITPVVFHPALLASKDTLVCLALTSCLGSILYALCFLMLYLFSVWISNQSHLCWLRSARFVHVVS